MVPSMFQKTMLYLGLAPEEEYDDLDQVDPYLDEQRQSAGGAPIAAAPAEPRQQASTAPAAPAAPAVTQSEAGAVRTISREQAVAAGARVSPAAPAPAGHHSSSVRTFTMSSAKPHVVAPRQFNEAQVVADRFKSEQPVILNLQDVDRDLRRRLIDFASGLSYGLGGRMDRVADGVYLLTPDNVEVSDDERRQLQERGLHH